LFDLDGIRLEGEKIGGELQIDIDHLGNGKIITLSPIHKLISAGPPTSKAVILLIVSRRKNCFNIYRIR
jgi:hypothetical protein